MTHTTTWEDDGVVGVKCDGNIVRDFTLDSDATKPRKCPRCGKNLRVIWDVRIEETDG